MARPIMTRNEQPGFDPGLYDQDFYSWTQQQTEALRALPRQPSVDLKPVDIAHLAEEIEDLGKRDLREAVSYLRLVDQHLVKPHAAPGSRDAAHWHAEAINPSPLHDVPSHPACGAWWRSATSGQAVAARPSAS